MLGFAMNDVYCAVLAYAYVFVILAVVETVWKGDRATGRKIMHISMGNIVFLLWLITTPWTAFIVAGSMVVFSLFTTPAALSILREALTRTQRETPFLKACRESVGRLSSITVHGAGNPYGLVYYCIAFTALAFVFYDRPIVVAAGMLPLAYGDGMGAIIGLKLGMHPYALIDRKSVEGTLAVFAATIVAATAGLAFYGVALPQAVGIALALGAVTAAVEAATPGGLDNLAIPVFTAGVFLLLEGVL